MAEIALGIFITIGPLGEPRLAAAPWRGAVLQTRAVSRRRGYELQAPCARDALRVVLRGHWSSESLPALLLTGTQHLLGC